MLIKNAMDIPLWVPPDIKAPKFGEEDVKNAPALAGTMDAVWGKLEPEEEVEAPDDAVKEFAKRAGWRVEVR